MDVRPVNRRHEDERRLDDLGVQGVRDRRPVGRAIEILRQHRDDDRQAQHHNHQAYDRSRRPLPPRQIGQSDPSSDRNRRNDRQVVVGAEKRARVQARTVRYEPQKNQ